MVLVMVTTVEIVRFRLSAAPMKRTRPSCFGVAQPRCPRPKSFAAVSSMLMMQEGCTPYSVTKYIKRNRSLSTCVSNSLGSVIFLCPSGAARYLKPAQRRKWPIHRPNLRAMPCCSATRLKMGRITDAETGTPASPTRSNFSRRLGMIAAQASRGSRPSFLFSSSHRRGVRVDSQGRETSGSHAARWSAIILLSHPCKWRSSV